MGSQGREQEHNSTCDKKRKRGYVTPLNDIGVNKARKFESEKR